MMLIVQNNLKTFFNCFFKDIYQFWICLFWTESRLSTQYLDILAQSTKSLIVAKNYLQNLVSHIHYKH